MVHQLLAYDLDLKTWFKCPIKGLGKVGMLSPEDISTCFSLFPTDGNHLCLLWMDHSTYAHTLYGLLHCTKVRVSIEVGARGKPRLDAFVVSSTSDVLDRGIWHLNDSAFVLYGEEDEACTKADDVTGANWAALVHGSCSSKGGCDMGYSFNRGERVGEWGGHDHAGRSCGLGG